MSQINPLRDYAQIRAFSNPFFPVYGQNCILIFPYFQTQKNKNQRKPVKSALFLIHLSNVIQFVGRKQLPITFLRMPTRQFLFVQFFKLSAKYLSHSKSTRLTCLRKLEIYGANVLVAQSRNILIYVGLSTLMIAAPFLTLASISGASERESL